MTRRTSSLLGPAVVILVAASSSALQQPVEPEPAQTEPTSQQEAPVAISISEIPRRAEESTVRLDEIERTVPADPGVEVIAAELPGWTRLLDEEQAEVERRDLSAMSLRDLNEAQNRWLSLSAQVDGWLGELEVRSTAMGSALEEIRGLEEVWSTTQQAATGDLPGPVRDTIANVLARADNVERAVLERLSVVLSIQSALGEHGVVVRAHLGRLDGALREARDSLLRADAEPLWSAGTIDDGRYDSSRALTGHFGGTWRSLRDYSRANTDRFAAHALTFLVLLWLFTALARRKEHWQQREELQSSSRALSHPFANALFLTLLLSRLFYPRAPLGLYELNRFLLLAPLLIILPRLVYSSMRGPLYGLAALYFGDLVVDLLPSEAFVTRLAQLTLSTIVLVALLRFSSTGRTAPGHPQGRWWRAAILAARAGTVILGVSIAANLLGRARLSSLLTEGALASAYTAVLLFAGYLVLQGLLTLLLETRALRSFESLRIKSDVIRGVATKLLRLVALGSWVWFTLMTFQLLSPFIDAAANVLGFTLSVGALEISLGDVVALLATIYLSIVVSRMARVILEEDVLPRFALPRGVPSTISKLARYTIVFIGLVVALVAAGIELNRLALLAGALGVGIGFGLQNIVNNFVSGIILLFERPIQSGDTIELDTVFGKVSRIGIRSSTVRTFEGAEVIVPNAHLIDGRLINWTYSDRLRRLEVRVGVAYGSRPQAVLDTLLQVAKKHDEILQEPVPYAIFDGFGESSLDFTLRAWTANFDDFLRIRSELAVGVHDALMRAGFEIPFPQRDLHVKSVPETVTSVMGLSSTDSANTANDNAESLQSGPEQAATIERRRSR
ncbi:MAG TPA: mechanosensitive ion channel domain-containing protein [Vicinamibacteria bacterium]|nr:mechanosensitive ion channel domain-containing protein [Vicinamibacteria bacterium]